MGRQRPLECSMLRVERGRRLERVNVCKDGARTLSSSSAEMSACAAPSTSGVRGWVAHHVY
jgi:hypothetical protein